MDSWRSVALEEVADEITVGYVGPMASQYEESGIPFLRSQDIEPYHIDLSKITHIGEEFHARLQKSSLKPGDVVIVRTGKPGAAAVVPDSLPIANCSDLVIVRPGKQLDSRFLVYYINTAGTEHVASHLVGAVQQHFNVASARKFQLQLPPIEEQRAIADVPGALDDRIELNRQMNETLEAVGRAIFKSWFVVFDPVRNKAQGRQPPGMTAELAALFPNEFASSSLGNIPMGWQISAIGDVVKVVGGSTPRTDQPSFWDGGVIAWATPKDLASIASPVLLDTERHITEQGLAQISSGLLPEGTVLMSSRAPIGYLAVSDVPVAVNQGFIAMVCGPQLPNYYVLHWARTNMDAIEARANGTTFLEISKGNFRPLQVVVPPRPVLDAFVAKVAPVHERIAANLKETKTLATLRDTLLPKLLSGEVRVYHSERAPEAAQ